MALENILGQLGQAGQTALGGLLAPPQGGLGGLLQDPMFRAGMGILAANQNPRQNIFQGAMGGLLGAQEMREAEAQREIEQAERERNEALRQDLSEFFRSQGQYAPMQSIYPPMSGQGFGMPMQSPAPMSEFDRILSEYTGGGMNYG